MGVIEWIVVPFQHEFMVRALIAVVLMGAITGAIGAFVVLRGLAFMGDALSHAIFPGIVAAFLLSQSIFLGALLAAGLTAASIAVLTSNRRIKEDSAIGVLLAGSFALGVVLISSSRNFTRDLTSFLFGNVLGVTWDDIWLSAIVGGAVILLLWLCYRELVIISFDRVGARAMGLPVFWLDLLLLLMLSLTIVVSLRAVGNILVVAMLVTPAAAARQLTNRLPVMIILSATIGVLSGITGLLVSFYRDVATGGTIVLVATMIFVVVWLIAPEHGILFNRLIPRRLASDEPESARVIESPAVHTSGHS
jgi:manganese/iron transport system permease protein